jgi:hypothetical protein
MLLKINTNVPISYLNLSAYSLGYEFETLLGSLYIYHSQFLWLVAKGIYSLLRLVVYVVVLWPLRKIALRC